MIDGPRIEAGEVRSVHVEIEAKYGRHETAGRLETHRLGGLASFIAAYCAAR